MKTESYGVEYTGGVVAGTRLGVPYLVTDPVAPDNGDAWINTTSGTVKYRHAGTTFELGISGGLDTEAVQDIVGAMATDSAQLDFSFDDTAGTFTATIVAGSITAAMVASDVATQAELDAVSTADRARNNHTGTQLAATISDFTEAAQDAVGAAVTNSSTVTFTVDDAANTITAAVLDSPTVGGQSAAQLQTTITAAIVDAAPGTLDTLNEFAAALGDDPNFAATILANLATKARTYDAALTGGALTEVVTHNLNTHVVQVEVWVDSGTRQSEGYIVQRTSVNTITIVSEGQNIPAGRRVMVVAKGA